MNIRGLQKTTLLDYPGHVASTIFTAGCNFRCSFCHNGELVLDPGSLEPISEEEVLAHLNKRKTVLDGVCISGGEPTLDPDLISFLAKVRETGLSIKLDTNGYRPEILRKVIDEGLVDYVAMDIKNSPELYAETIGKTAFDLSSVNESLELLKEGRVPYEFRTTVTKNFHNLKSLLEIADWISGCDSYYLQQFVNSGQLIDETITGYTDEELKALYREVKRKLPCTQLRGV